MARTTQNPLDRNVSLRLPVALLHRVENQITAANNSRMADGHNNDGSPVTPPISLSEALRKLIETGLDIRENGTESQFMRDTLNNALADRLTAMLALGIHDKGARALLEQIAKHKPEPKKEFPWD